MALFSGSKTATIESLQAELLAAQGEAKISDEKNIALTQAIEVAEGATEAVQAELDETKASLETVKAELAEEKDTFEARAHERARDIAAEAGTEKPIAETIDDDDTPTETPSAQYAKITDPQEKAVFFQSHKTELIAEAHSAAK